MCDECQSLVIDVNVNVNVVKGGVAEFLCYKVTIRPLLLIIKEFAKDEYLPPSRSTLET